jgi:hypothetical protein
MTDVAARPRLTVDIEAGVADVRLDRAEKMNALDNAMFEGLAADAEDAALIRRSLERDGHGPVRVSTGAGGLHRVRVGPLDSREEAEGLGGQTGGMLLSCAGMNL